MRQHSRDAIAQHLALPEPEVERMRRTKCEPVAGMLGEKAVVENERDARLAALPGTKRGNVGALASARVAKTAVERGDLGPDLRIPRAIACEQ